MLTEEEKEFIKYWEANRLSRKKGFRKLSFGLPVAVTVAIAILVNFFSGWYKKADMEIRSNGSLVLVVLIAVIIIVVFITLFSAYHKWDINEQHYRELLARKDEA